jgi:hypothetical protein
MVSGMVRSGRHLAALVLVSLAACIAIPPSPPKAGEEYEISKSYETSDKSDDGSSGSSRGRDTILERLIEIRDDGLELEYDLPKDTKAEERARSWQFPFRVFRPSSGPMQLLNGPELEARVDDWLKAAKWTREMCGRWIFTWNAFRIECDPHSVIQIAEAFDLRHAVREGAAYQDSKARGPGTLTRTAAGPDGATFTTAMEIDPAAVHRARAESDVAAGEMMRKPVTMDAALSERVKERVSGTISVTLDTDAQGNVRRRTEVIKVEIGRPDGKHESRTATEIVERRPAASR